MATKTNTRSHSIRNWLRSSRWNLAVAGILAVGLIAAVATFASGPTTQVGLTGTTASCPESVVDWAVEQGWDDPNGFTCDVNYAKHVDDPQAGAIAASQFQNIDTEGQLTEYLNSNDPQASLIRQQARDSMTDDEYDAWINGSFVAVQFLQPAAIEDAAVNQDGTIQYPDTPRYVPDGDVTFVYVDPNEGEDVAAGASVANAAAPQKKSNKPAVASAKITTANSINASLSAKKKTKKNNAKKPAATGGFTAPNNPALQDQKKQKKGKVKQHGNIRKDCGNINANVKNPGKTGYLRVIKFNDKNGNGREDKGEAWKSADNGRVQFKLTGLGKNKGINRGPYTARVDDNPGKNDQISITVEGLPVGDYKVTEVFNNKNWKVTTAGGKTQTAHVKDHGKKSDKCGDKRCDVLFFGNQKKPNVVASPTPKPTQSPSKPPTPAPSPTSCVDGKPLKPGDPVPTCPPTATPGPTTTNPPVNPPENPNNTISVPSGGVKGGALPKTGTSGTIALVTILVALAVYGAGRYALAHQKPKRKKR